MDYFRSGLAHTTVLYFPLIEERFVRKNDIFQLTNGRCDQAEVDGVLDRIESECGHFTQKKRIIGRNRVCLAIFILCFISGLTSVMISSGVNTSIGFYVGIGIVTTALLLVLLILLINRMLNRVEAHYLNVIQSALEQSNARIEKGGVQWNTRAINLNYLELRVVEDDMVMKQMFGHMKAFHGNKDMIIEEGGDDDATATDRHRMSRVHSGVNGLRKTAHKRPASSDEDDDEESGTEEGDDDEEDDDEEDDDEEEEESEEEESGSEVGSKDN